VGHSGLVVNEPPEVELIYAFARDAWGKGFATEASERLIAFAFEELIVDQLAALVFPENVASCRVLEKLGFVQRGEVERFGASLLRFILAR
jgi:RimJ/RimL family protein N-acetyltransferase